MEIDIKPGSYPNCFNINGNGVIPVAILGSDDVDVLDIKDASLALYSFRVRTRGNGGPMCSAEEVNGDGFLDKVCQFEDDATFWKPGEMPGVLTGALFDGTLIEGSDTICLVPNN